MPKKITWLGGRGEGGTAGSWRNRYVEENKATWFGGRGVEERNGAQYSKGMLRSPR